MKSKTVIFYRKHRDGRHFMRYTFRVGAEMSIAADGKLMRFVGDRVVEEEMYDDVKKSFHALFYGPIRYAMNQYLEEETSSETWWGKRCMRLLVERVIDRLVGRWRILPEPEETRCRCRDEKQLKRWKRFHRRMLAQNWRQL